MAIDYNTDILSLYAGKVVTEPEYAAIDADLRDQASEQRILTTIEVLRSHLEIIESRTESNLLMEAISRLTAKIGSGGFVYTPERITSEGNVSGPQFVAGASVDITFGGSTISPVISAPGTLEEIVLQLNSELTGATVEDSTFTALADSTPGALGGTHLTLNANTGVQPGDYYVWFRNPARPEITDVTAVADVAGNLGGKYFTLDTPTTPYYVWYNVAPRQETFTIDWTGINGAALPTGAVAAAYFDVDTNVIGAIRFWFSDGSTTTPVAGGRTLFPIVFTGAETDQQISDLVLAAMLGTDPDFTNATNAGGTTPLITCQLTQNGSVPDVVDGAVATGAVFAVTVQGISASVDPAPGGKTAIQIDINGDSLAGAVAVGTQSVLDALPDFSVPFPGVATIAITNTTAGDATDATAATSGFGVTVTQQGTDAGSDPAVATNEIVVDYTIGGSANVIAGEVRAAIAAQAGSVFVITGATNQIIVTNAVGGNVTDATEGTTGWAAPSITDGVDGTPVGVEAFKTAGDRLGFRNVQGSEDTPFTLADGTGGVLGPAGLVAGDFITRKAAVANIARDRSLTVYSGQKRNSAL